MQVNTPKTLKEIKAEFARTKLIIEAKYATTDSKELALECGIEVPVLQQRARQLKVTKCRKFFAKQVSERRKAAGKSVKKPKLTKQRQILQDQLNHHISLFASNGLPIKFVACKILEKIQSSENGKFDFLTIRDER